MSICAFEADCSDSIAPELLEIAIEMLASIDKVILTKEFLDHNSELSSTLALRQEDGILNSVKTLIKNSLRSHILCDSAKNKAY